MRTNESQKLFFKHKKEAFWQNKKNQTTMKAVAVLLLALVAINQASPFFYRPVHVAKQLKMASLL
jgi:hypothetical protein